jgi:serine phosphatase RsbU (regulator of sigma subunit)
MITSIIILSFSVLILAALLLVCTIKYKKLSNIKARQINIIDKKNQVLTDNLKCAHVIQKAFLPSHELFSQLFPYSMIISKPKEIVNGDFIWYYQNTDFIIVAMVDCTGHGVPASLMSIIGNNLLNTIIREYGFNSPSKVLRSLDQLLKNEFETSQDSQVFVEGMDIAICYISKKEIIYSGALMPIVISSSGTCKLFKGNNYPLGGYIIKREKIFKDQTIPYKKGDRIYMFSDGFYDQFGGDHGKPMRLKNFIESIKQAQSIPILNQEKYFNDYLNNWMSNYDQIDDISLIGIEL